MFKYAVMLALGFSSFSLAEEDTDVAIIITNYQYDSWGRPVGRSVQYQPGAYYNPYGNPYNDPYYQYPGSLPGADPDRFEEIFEKNSRR